MKKLIEKIPIPDEISNERYFQIRDVGKNGCGSFKTFCVLGDANDKEIGDIASEAWTNEMLRKEVATAYKNPTISTEIG